MEGGESELLRLVRIKSVNKKMNKSSRVEECKKMNKSSRVEECKKMNKSSRVEECKIKNEI
jgi:hypothetical protein